MTSGPDFWLIECDGFWWHVPPAVACAIIAGPAEMLSDGEQWLVRTDPSVIEADGTMTDRVLVDRHPPDLEEGNDWSILCTGAYSLALSAAPALAATWNEIEGTANADHIRGTAATDRIRGLGGNDVLRGWAGDDLLVGGPGDDLLKGGLGQDTYICGGGQDVVVVNFSRQTEQFGDGCEAVIFDA